MFEIELNWGTVAGDFSLPYVTVDALPAEGTEVLLKAHNPAYDTLFPKGFTTQFYYHTVKVEKVVLDAEDPADTGYLVYVIPA